MTTDKKDVTYGTEPREPLRTVDRPFTPVHDAARDALRALVNFTNDEGSSASGPMPAPHLGERFSQRQAAAKLLAGRSYQAVQDWLKPKPMPEGLVDWLTNDLQRVDARTEDRMVRVLDDEIAIVVKR